MKIVHIIFISLSSVLEKSIALLHLKILPVSFQLGVPKTPGRLTGTVPLKFSPFALAEIFRLTFHNKPEKLVLIPFPGGLINFTVIFCSCKMKLNHLITVYLIC